MTLYQINGRHIFDTFLSRQTGVTEEQWNHWRLKLPRFVNCFKIDFILKMYDVI